MSDVWDKYKTADQPIICMVGVIALCVSLSKIDGDFSDDELLEILKLVPHKEEESDYILNLINEIDEGNLDFTFHAQNLKKYLGDQKNFLEFIIATLYKLALTDHVIDEKELEMIKKTKKIFEES